MGKQTQRGTAGKMLGCGSKEFLHQNPLLQPRTEVLTEDIEPSRAKRAVAFAHKHTKMPSHGHGISKNPALVWLLLREKGTMENGTPIPAARGDPSPLQSGKRLP